MDRKKTSHVLSILMESDLYFDFTLMERLSLVKNIMSRLN